MTKTRVRAIVRVTVDILASSVWDGTTDWDQIYKQAECDVRDMLNNPMSLVTTPESIRNIDVVNVIVTKG